MDQENHESFFMIVCSFGMQERIAMGDQQKEHYQL
jgi:hypothetical protein